MKQKGIWRRWFCLLLTLALLVSQFAVAQSVYAEETEEDTTYEETEEDTTYEATEETTETEEETETEEDESDTEDEEDETEEGDTETSHTHDYQAVVTEPTCTDAGYTTYTCSGCEDSYITDTIPATGHTYDEGTVTTEPTCSDDGIMTYTCTVCGDTYTEVIEATGHTWGGQRLHNL